MTQEIQDIPADYTYTITEANDVWYDTTAELDTGSIIADETKECVYTNARKSTTLSISKTVTGNMGNRNQLFDFEVYVVDEGRELTGNYQAVVAHGDGTASDTTMTFAEGASVVKLKHGDVLTIFGLPVGARYEVDELARSRMGYAYTSTNESGFLTEEGITSAWTNKKQVAIPTNVKGIGMIAGIIAVLFGLYFLFRKRGRRCMNP